MVPLFASAQDKPDPLSGAAEVGYRYRTDSDHVDQDWFQRLNALYSVPLPGGGFERANFVFSGQLREDVDGQADEDRYDPFREINDVYDQSVMGWLYLAYGEAVGSGTVPLVRLGRQDSVALEPIAFDGGLVTLQPGGRKISLTALGGIPTNLYEGNREGDWLAGGYVDVFPVRTLSLRGGYLYLQDRVKLLTGREEDLEEDLAVFQASWRPLPGDRIQIKGTLRDGEFSDLVVRCLHTDPDHDFNVSAYYRGLFLTREAAPISSDPLALVLGPYEPYHQGGVDLYKGITGWLGVEAGASFRVLQDSDREGAYNHDYDHYLLALLFHGVQSPQMQLLVGLDWWNSPGSAETRTVRAEFQQGFAKGGYVRAGTLFDMYQVDQLTGEEREEAQTYYVGLALPTISDVQLVLDYSYEDSTLREVDTFQARLRYAF